MRSLVEKGHIYIAQPPLYKIKRGKREEYIQNEGGMNEMLLELGTEGATLTNTKSSKKYSDKQFKELLELLVELDILTSALAKKGVKWSDLLEKRHLKTKKLPIFRVKVEDDTHFLYNDDELAKLAKEEEKGKEETNLDVLEIYEAPEIEELIKKLDKMDLDIELFEKEKAEEEDKKKSKKPAKKKTKAKAKAPFVLTNDVKIEIYSLRELLYYIKEEGKRGMTIQRYKGLGEMNPEQLWETTMDPERRTILQVKLEDAGAANEMFSVLMGDQVEPRRKFIEDHAHEVRNLDI